VFSSYLAQQMIAARERDARELARNARRAAEAQTTKRRQVPRLALRVYHTAARAERCAARERRPPLDVEGWDTRGQAYTQTS
jgi:hypothetical protein